MKNTVAKFDIPFDVIDNGTGRFYGALEDLNLSEGSTLEWVAPRRILKVPPELALQGGMVIQSELGIKYMVAFYSPSETSMGPPFRAFKLYQVSVVATLTRRNTVIEIRTGLPQEATPSPAIDIYASFEPLQEAFDRELRIPNEKSRLITNEPLQRGDIINNDMKVIEAHEFQGLWGAVLG